MKEENAEKYRIKESDKYIENEKAKIMEDIVNNKSEWLKIRDDIEYVMRAVLYEGIYEDEGIVINYIVKYNYSDVVYGSYGKYKFVVDYTVTLQGESEFGIQEYMIEAIKEIFKRYGVVNVDVIFKRGKVIISVGVGFDAVINVSKVMDDMRSGNDD